MEEARVPAALVERIKQGKREAAWWLSLVTATHVSLVRQKGEKGIAPDSLGG
jgi:hypothetical protein